MPLKQGTIGCVVNRYKRKLHSDVFNPKLAAPQDVFIEITNRCNYSCAICPLKESTQPKKDMEPSLFKKIIDNLARWDNHRDSLVLHAFGEPFLNKHIFDYFDYVAERLPQCKTYVSTNFAALSHEEIEHFFHPRALNVEIGVYVDAISADTYARQRGGSYETVIANIGYFLSLKKKFSTQNPTFHVGMIVTRYNRKEEREFIELWKKKLAGAEGVSIHIYYRSHDWAGQIVSDAVFFRKKRYGNYKNVCPMPFKTLVIFSNGDAGLCCYDVNHKIIIGNVSERPLEELWGGSEAITFRNDMISLALDYFRPCKNCIDYHKPFSDLIRRVFKSFRKKLKRPVQLSRTWRPLVESPYVKIIAIDSQKR